MDIKTVLVSAGVSAVVAVTAPALVNSVTLQASSPGIPDSGSLNVSGNAIAGRIGANVVPGLARIQVNETGTLQGVRAVTSSGVSVYGQNTAATGLGAGGYFTSASVGGRALVGEQISLNGNTVGGLFFNRSQTGGVALWGKHISNSGATTGVYGEVASQTGNAATFVNNSSGTRVDLGGGGANAVLAKGDIKRDYGVVNASCVPIAYGWVNSAGVRVSGTDNWTSTYSMVDNRYVITISGVGYDISNGDTAVASPLSPFNYFVGVDSDGLGNLLVFTRSAAGAAIQAQFSFVVFSKANATLSPKLPSLGNMTMSQWAAQHPKEAKRLADELARSAPSQVANPLPPPQMP